MELHRSFTHLTGRIPQRKADERTQTAYPCSSYEFACAYPSPSYCVRKLTFLGRFRLSGGVGSSIVY